MAGKWSDSGVTEFMTFTLVLSQETRSTAKGKRLSPVLRRFKTLTDLPIHAFEWSLIQMGPDVDENMIPPFVRLFAPFDIAAKFID